MQFHFSLFIFLSVSTTIIKSHQEFVECLIIFLSKCFTIINVEFCQNCYYQSVADRRRKACNLIIKLSNFNFITIYFWNHKHKVYINSLNFKWIMRISVLSAPCPSIGIFWCCLIFMKMFPWIKSIWGDNSKVAKLNLMVTALNVSLMPPEGLIMRIPGEKTRENVNKVHCY